MKNNLQDIISAMMDKYIFNNPYMETIFLFLTIASIGLVVIFYLRSKRNKSPKYAIRSINLVEDFVNDLKSLEMKYNGEQINDLTVSKVAFWNKGRETIHKLDIAKADPIKIQAKDGFRILDAKIIYQKKSANLFTTNINQEKTFVEVSFDYFDKNEGIVIQIIHTGRNSKDLDIKGTIKGADPLKKVTVYSSRAITSMLPLGRITKSKISFNMKRRITGILFLVLPITFVSGIMSSGGNKEMSDAFKYSLAAFMILSYWTFAFMALRRKLPSGFEIFDEEK
jgi:hypothetical protein